MFKSLIVYKKGVQLLHSGVEQRNFSATWVNKPKFSGTLMLYRVQNQQEAKKHAEKVYFKDQIENKK